MKLSEEDQLALVNALEEDVNISDEVISRWKEAGKRYKKLLEEGYSFKEVIEVSDKIH
jgi:hypothetical protein